MRAVPPAWVRVVMAARSASAALAMVVALAGALAAGEARAQPADGGDGYCDYVLGVAHAESARRFSPDVFGTFGFVEQSPSSVNPSVQSDGSLRFIGGLRFSLSNVYEGLALRERAKADCKRHEAVDQVRSETMHQALEARLKVYEEALPEADKVLAQVRADMSDRRTTAQEATATRLRVEELRRLATDARTQLRNLPARSGKLEGALTAFQQADDEVERQDAKLRRAAALDISVRFGVDSFLNRTDTTSPYFALVYASVNLGVLWQSSGNDRAAAGRKKLNRAGRDPISVEATDVLVEQVTRRSEETATLEADLEKQLEVLTRVGGDESRRYRQIVWFDLVKIRADRAYHEAYLAALRQARGGGVSP